MLIVLQLFESDSNHLLQTQNEDKFTRQKINEQHTLFGKINVKKNGGFLSLFDLLLKVSLKLYTFSFILIIFGLVEIYYDKNPYIQM